jgi:hypothetical protein
MSEAKIVSTISSSCAKLSLTVTCSDTNISLRQSVIVMMNL